MASATHPNPQTAASIYAQNAQLDRALDRRAPKVVAVFAVVVEAYDVLPDGTEVLRPVRRAITRSVEIKAVA